MRQTDYKSKEHHRNIIGPLLWCVDPDDVQVAVIHTLLVFVSVTRASLCSSPDPRRVTARAQLRLTLKSTTAAATTKVIHTTCWERAQLDPFHLQLVAHIYAR